MNFSVLISLYHKENPVFLKESLDSLKNQTVQANEIIIVFDGKITSDLEEVVDIYKNILPIEIVRLPENVGLGKALNEGLKYCSYEWVFRMDTDDICVSNRFEKQVDFIQQNPNIVLFGGQIIEFDDNIHKKTNSRKTPISNEDIIKFAKKRCPFNHMTVAYKKNIVLEVGGYKHHLMMEDYNLWLRVISKKYKVANIDDVLVYARGGSNMIARRRGFSYIKSEWQLFKLKNNLKIGNPFFSFTIFTIRSLIRFLPTSILKKIYSKFLRI